MQTLINVSRGLRSKSVKSRDPFLIFHRKWKSGAFLATTHLCNVIQKYGASSSVDRLHSKREREWIRLKEAGCTGKTSSLNISTDDHKALVLSLTLPLSAACEKELFTSQYHQKQVRLLLVRLSSAMHSCLSGIDNRDF